MNRTAITALSIFVAAAALPAFADDITLTSRATQEGKSTTSVTYISKDHVRRAHGDGKETIFDAATGQMTAIDNTKKTYYVTTREDMNKFAAKMQEKMNSPEMKRARQGMKNQPAMAGMFEVDVKDTGVSRRVAGYSCKVWTLRIGDMSTTEECLTNDLQIPTQVWEMFRNYSDGMKNMMSSMGAMASGMDKMQEQMKKMKGYPIASKTTVDVMGHKTVVENELIGVKRGPIPASTWEAPAGYTRVENPMLRAMNRMRS